MTHTQTVNLILDGTQSNGVLFQTLTTSARTALKTAGRAYMLAHATGKREVMLTAESDILRAVGR